VFTRDSVTAAVMRINITLYAAKYAHNIASITCWRTDVSPGTNTENKKAAQRLSLVNVASDIQQNILNFLTDNQL